MSESINGNLYKVKWLPISLSLILSSNLKASSKFYKKNQIKYEE